MLLHSIVLVIIVDVVRVLVAGISALVAVCVTAVVVVVRAALNDNAVFQSVVVADAVLIGMLVLMLVPHS